jgi:hypothetical protein
MTRFLLPFTFGLTALAGTPALRFAELPLSFEPNRGQADRDFRFLSRAPGLALALTGDGATIALRGCKTAATADCAAAMVRMRIVGASRSVTLAGREPLGGFSNYLSGSDPAKWVRDVPQYRKVEYHGIYPGTDLVFYGNGQRMEYDFVVAPGADPGRIRLSYEGASSLQLEESGDLVIHTAAGDLRWNKPVAYQMSEGSRREIAARFAVRQGVVSFEAGEYDRALPLVIDPVLVFSTHFGGSGAYANHVATDAVGNIYVAGHPGSPFPLKNPFQGTASSWGRSDAFVSKLNPSGTAVIYSTYLHGKSTSMGAGSMDMNLTGLAVDGAGNSYLAGRTYAQDLPLKNAFLTSGQVFLMKLNSAGNDLVFSTYVAQQATGFPVAVGLDAAGNAYVTGTGTAPLYHGLTYQTGSAFVMKVDSQGGLVYSSRIPGSNASAAIAVDTAGNAYVAGRTWDFSFRGTTGAYKTLQVADRDGFVAKINAAGTGIAYATLFGSSQSGYNQTDIHGIAVDSAGQAYIAGYTNNSTGFPIRNSLSGLATRYDGAFLAKFNAAGSDLLFSTFVGGSFDLGANAIALDSRGAVIVAGDGSPGLLCNAIESEGSTFITKIDGTNRQCLFSTAFNGETISGLAVDPSDNIIVAGHTSAPMFPVTPPTLGNDLAGNYDAFVAKFSDSALPCSYFVAPRHAAFPQMGGSGAFRVTANSGSCSWTATTTTDWIRITSQAGGSGIRQVEYTVEFNPGPTRTGTITVGNTHFKVVQTNNTTECSYAVSTGYISVSAAGGVPANVNVTAQTGCPWTAAADASWVSVNSGAGGSGNGSVGLSVASNSGAGDRAATVLIAGHPVTIYQEPRVTSPPAVASLAPAAGSGGSQTLTLAINAPGGYQTLDVINLLINSALDGRQACYLAYSRPSNALYIVADNGDSTAISGKVMDGSGTVGNSQCTVSLAGSSGTGNGNAFTLVLNLSFSAPFAGNKVVYAAARDVYQNNSGWQTVGVHGVPPLPAAFPKPTGLSPSSGSTLSQTITFTFQDQSSASNLQTVWALINTAIDGRGACYAAYYRPGNQLYLYPDNGDGAQATSIILTGSNTIGNSQCTVAAQGSSVQANGNTLTVTLPITFKTAFAGFKGVWMAAQTLGGQTSSWQALGAEVIPGQ